MIMSALGYSCQSGVCFDKIGKIVIRFLMKQANYQNFRAQFLNAAKALGLNVQSMQIDDPGLEGELLFQDYVVLHPGAKNKVIILSGVHGVEGYIGSLIQTEILNKIKCNEVIVPEHVEFTFVHAVNPYGMSWGRRFNAQNVDLNRNVLVSNLNSLQESETILKRIQPLLNSKNRFEFVFQFIRQCPLLIQFGVDRVVQAIAGGQSLFPKSVFYAGSQIQQEILNLQNFFESKHFDPEGKTVVIDIHSGLGPYGVGLVIADAESLQDEQKHFLRGFGRRFIGEHKPKGYYKAHGVLENLFYFSSHINKGHLLYMTLEFGTYSSLQILSQLVLENSQFHLLKVKTLKNRKLLNAFFPIDTRWQQTCSEQAIECLKQCFEFVSK